MNGDDVLVPKAGKIRKSPKSIKYFIQSKIWSNKGMTIENLELEVTHYMQFE